MNQLNSLDRLPSWYHPRMCPRGSGGCLCVHRGATRQYIEGGEREWRCLSVCVDGEGRRRKLRIRGDAERRREDAAWLGRRRLLYPVENTQRFFVLYFVIVSFPGQLSLSLPPTEYIDPLLLLRSSFSGGKKKVKEDAQRLFIHSHQEREETLNNSLYFLVSLFLLSFFRWFDSSRICRKSLENAIDNRSVRARR